MADSLENFGQLSKSSRTLSRSGSSWIKHETAAREFPAELAGKAVMELSISCSNLPKMDFFGLSDPFVVMYVTGLNNEKKVMKMGQTETIWFCLDPSFVKVFDLPLDTPKDAVLKCELYDRDGPTDQLTRHDYMGTVKVKFEELLGAKGGQLEKNIVNEDTRKVNKVQVRVSPISYSVPLLSPSYFPTSFHSAVGISSARREFSSFSAPIDPFSAHSSARPFSDHSATNLFLCPADTYILHDKVESTRSTQPMAVSVRTEQRDETTKKGDKMVL